MNEKIVNYAIKKGFHINKVDEDGATYLSKSKRYSHHYLVIEDGTVNGVSDWKAEIDSLAKF